MATLVRRHSEPYHPGDCPYFPGDLEALWLLKKYSCLLLRSAPRIHEAMSLHTVREYGTGEHLVAAKASIA
jgi:hypothetical protein